MPRLFQALQSDRLPVEPVLGSFLRILWVESVVLLAVVVAAAVLSSTHLVGGSQGYAAKIDGEGPQAMFAFDDAAARLSLSTMQDQLPRLLVDKPDGVAFDEFFAERSNTTPATKAMVEKTMLRLVREKEVEIVDLDGKVRNVRTALQSDHVVRLRSQRRFVF